MSSSAPLELHPKTVPGDNGPNTTADAGGQCWFYWGLLLGFPVWFSVQLCSVLLRRSVGMAANPPKSAF